MRQDITSDQRAILGERGRLVRPVRLEIQNGSGTWKEVTNLDAGDATGLSFFRGASWQDDIDAATWTGTVQLAESVRVAGVEYSIAPDVASSPINVDDADDPDPLIDGMRRIRWFTTTHRLTGLGGTEKKVFDGYIVSSEQQGRISLAVADLGHRLVITQIRDERVYGTTAGVSLASVIQQILDDNFGAGVYTLVVDADVTAAGVMVRQYKQDRVKVMEAIRSLAMNTIGANVRFMWNASGEMELRLFLPPRTKTVPDFTFTADNYFPVPSFRRNTEDIRNDGALYYQNRDRKAVVFVTSRVQESIDRYFARYFEFREIATKHVDTEPEAQRMLDTAIGDMGFPKAEKQFTTPYAWPFEVHDLLLMTANGRQYTTDQQQWVTRLSHTLGPAGETRSQFDTRGTIAGFYNRWQIQHGPGPRPTDENALLPLTSMGGESHMYGGELFNGAEDGCVWLYIFAGLNLRRFHIWHRETAPGATVPLWPPTGSDMYKAATIDRPEGKIPSEGNYTFGPGPYEGRRVWRFLVPLPTTQDSTAAVIVMAEDENGKFTQEVRYTAVATDSGAGDPGGFAAISITRPTANTLQVTYLPQIASGATFIFRNGINIDQINDDGDEKTWLDEEVHADREYQVQAVRVSNNASGPRTIVTIAPHNPSLAFDNDTPVLDTWEGVQAVRIEAGGLPGGTTHIGIEKSVDSGQYDPWTGATRLPVADLPWFDVVVLASQYYRLVAYDADGDVLDTSLPAYWTRPV